MTDENPKVTRIGQPESVPVFNCIVLLRRNEEGKHAARVGNFDGLTAIGSSEREALADIVKAFKAKMAEFHERGEDPPFVDPPHAAAADEVTRWVPVHL